MRGFSVGHLAVTCLQLAGNYLLPAARDRVERAQQSLKSGEWFDLAMMAGRSKPKIRLRSAALGDAERIVHRVEKQMNQTLHRQTYEPM